MTKKAFIEATKYQSNSIRRVGITNIAKVNWLNTPWLIVEDGETFEEVSKLDFIPIARFSTLGDLWNTYKNII